MGSTMSQSGSKTTSGGSVRQFIESEVQNKKVVIWSKSYCPFCHATKSVFHGLGVQSIAVHELDLMDDGNAIQQELTQMTGQRTVPNVFINGKHLGGNDDTQKAKATGELARLLSLS